MGLLTNDIYVIGPMSILPLRRVFIEREVINYIVCHQLADGADEDIEPGTTGNSQHSYNRASQRAL